MKVDLVLTDDGGESFWWTPSTRSSTLPRDHAGLSQDDFYQMYAYGTAGRRRYDEIVLLYPATAPVVTLPSIRMGSRCG